MKHPGGLCNTKIKLMDYIHKLDIVEMKIREAPPKRRASLKQQRQGILKSIEVLSAFLDRQGKLSLAEKRKLYTMGYLTTSDFEVTI